MDTGACLSLTILIWLCLLFAASWTEFVSQIFSSDFDDLYFALRCSVRLAGRYISGMNESVFCFER